MLSSQFSADFATLDLYYHRGFEVSTRIDDATRRTLSAAAPST